ELVNLVLRLHYGNAESLKGQGTAARILPSLMHRGTKKHSRQEIEDALDKLEATLHVGGSAGGLSASIECKRGKRPQVLTLLGEILREPTLDEKEFDILKRQRTTQLKAFQTEPQVLAGLELERKLAPYPKDDVRYTPTIDEALARAEAVT